jgi:diguanylate cyclase (GGDEF)-like protein/PAS domain S-box-containing protein
MPDQPSILIVDDVADNIRIVAGILQACAYRIAFATDGKSALENVAANPYDLILLDVMMPDMDGFEVCRRLKQDPDTAHVPVIFLTAKTDHESVLEGFQSGGVDYVTKPFNSAELQVRIDTHLRLKRAMDELRLAEKVFHSLGEAIIITDSNNRILKINPAFTEITGYTEEEVVGQNPKMLKSGRLDEDFYQKMWGTLQEKGNWRGEIWNRRKDGRIYPEWLSISTLRGWKGKVENYVGVFSDITQRKQAEELIRYQAHHDPLTDLPNRTLFRIQLQRALEGAKANGDKLALLFIDLDGFKDVNDKRGHDVGDRLLAETARRLGESMRSSDVIARVGGDEFVAILPELRSIAEAKTVADKIIGLLETPYTIAGESSSISGSIGISVFPDDSETPHMLVTYADKAMYGAKQAGKARSLFYYELAQEELGQDGDGEGR